MATTHDDAQTWRDLADTLTPEQVAYLENWERKPMPGLDNDHRVHQRGLLSAAQEFAGSNAAAAYYADVVEPPDARQVDAWMDEGDVCWLRRFDGTKRDVDNVTVHISGVQFSDGRIERTMIVSPNTFGDDGYMPAATARQLARALIEAADELENRLDEFTA
jgi:hypothetical protein